MTWAIILGSFGAGALVVCGLWWATSPNGVREGEAEPSEFAAYWWERDL